MRGIGVAQAFACVLGPAIIAHPMGNFSVSHYTRIEVSGTRAQVTYVLDLAEVPTYALLRDWNTTAQPEMNAKAAGQAKGLEFTAAGRPVQPRVTSSEIQLSKSGDLQTARITIRMELDGVKPPLRFEDRNFPDRAGWKEIVIRPGSGAEIETASHSAEDRSQALTEYAGAAPQDLRASVEWRPAGTSRAAARIVAIEQPPVVPAPQAQNAAPASTPQTNGDFLSRLLGRREIGVGWLLVGMVVAFGFGAAHALTPGHGKTIVAAYLVGSRGTMGHAAFLGAMVTFTHTISVFLLGIGTLLLSNYIVPEKIIPVLGAISGLSIVAIGASLFYKRFKKLQAAANHHHHHHHDHDHDHDHHHHDHDHHHHDHHHHHHHDHNHHDHKHDHAHSHVPEGDITLGSLIALGASGGLVPCPSALVLLLSSIALGHVGAGLILLVAFSLGLAGVLMGIGMMVLYAKNWLPDPFKTSQHPVFRLVPVLSAAVIVCIGLLMTGVSLGWVRPGLAG